MSCSSVSTGSYSGVYGGLSMCHIKKYINLYIACLLTILTLINCAFVIASYYFMPYSYIGFTVGWFVFLFLLVVLSFKFRKKFSRTSKVFGYLMPLFTVFLAVSLIFSMEFHQSYYCKSRLCFSIS